VSFGAKHPATVIRSCPKCGRKNRVPAVLPRSGQYTCGACRATIVAGGAGGARLRLLAADMGSLVRNTASSMRLARLGRMPKWLSRAYVVWALTLATVSFSDAIGPERWWPGSANLYMPQWIWALPAIVLTPWTIRAAPKWTGLSAIILACVFGPLMGFVWHPIAPSVAPGGVTIRVMQCNVKWAFRDRVALAVEVERQHPDLIQLQDSGGILKNLGPIAQVLAGWNVRSSGQYITASRLPMSDPESVDISFPGADIHHCTRILLTVGREQVALYNVHLLTPRWGLMSMRHRDVGGMDSNVEERLYEANKLADDLRDEQIPVLLTGDLNAPIQALVCRTLMDGQLHDAFADAGSGYGYSYGQFAAEHLLARLHLSWLGLPYVRIDHILYSKQWTAIDCWTGSDKISDHVPVYADLYLSGAAP
jgi:vancomycin resistance protein VanJ